VPEPGNLLLFRLHLPVASEAMLRVFRELFHPTAQLRGMHAQVFGNLIERYAPIPDQAHSLKLQLPRKLLPLHDPPAVPLSHQTWCLWSRVQARMGASALEHTSVV